MGLGGVDCYVRMDLNGISDYCSNKKEFDSQKKIIISRILNSVFDFVNILLPSWCIIYFPKRGMSVEFLTFKFCR